MTAGTGYNTAVRIYRRLRCLVNHWKLKRAAGSPPVRLVIGASGVYDPGWVPSDIDNIDLLDSATWDRYFAPDAIDAILAEHVWEHLTEAEASSAARNCFRYLKPGGYLRVAVPDGLHPSPEYIAAVEPGGSGAGAEDHKVLYDYAGLSAIFEQAGFRVRLLEFFDEKGEFHFQQWDPAQGMITRSSRYDDRNRPGSLRFTSIILDAFKTQPS